MTLKQILENELARAEAVVNKAEKRKGHQPTIDNHKGQAIAFRKVLSWLEIDTNYVRGPIKVDSYLTISWPAIFMVAASIVLLIIIAL